MSIESFENYLNQADTAARAGDWTATINLLQSALELQPDHTGVLTGMGTCLIQLNRPGEALSFFTQVVNLAPQSVEAHNNLGVCHVLLGEFDKAEHSYRQAITLDPNHATAWKNLAQSLLQQPQKMGEGVEILAALVKANPQDVECLMMLGECYEIAGEKKSAAVLYQQALTVSPDLATAREALNRVKSDQQE